MLKQLKTSQFNADNQDADNSWQSDSSDDDSGQSSFDSPNPFDDGTLDWSPRAFYVDTGSQSHLGWGAGFPPSPTFASGNNSASSLSDASSLLPGASAAAANAPSVSSAASASSVLSAAGSSALSEGSGSSGGSVVVSTPGSGLVFDNTYTTSCTAAFEDCIVAAEDQLESLFTNSITLNITFQEQNEGNNHVALGNGWPSSVNVSYATLKAHLPSTDYLPATDPDPAGGNDWNLPEAYARMLGISSSAPSTDDTVTLNSYYNWDFGQDVINGLTHEISEGGMGRVGSLGGQSGTGNWSTMDLFRYTASDTPDYTDGRDGVTTYFYNGGGTLSDQDLPAKGAPTLSFFNNFNTSDTFSKGDSDDWSQTQVFGATNAGETLALDQTELEVMQALGWNLSLKQDVDSISGSWETPTNWSTGSMPIEPQDAYIDGVTVSLDSNVIVNSIATSSSGILLIGNNAPTTLTAVRGTDLNTEDASSVASGNLGDTFVYTGSTLRIGYVSDTFDNANTLGIGKGAGGSGAGDLDIANSITLDGGGTVTLGQSGTAGDILDFPGASSSDSLANVDNTIETQSGSTGLISLDDSFDNQAGGKVESFSFLRIIVPTVSNEGAMTAESGATLDVSGDFDSGVFTNSGTMTADSSGATLGLGADGATETLTNDGNGLTTGAINIDSSARLAISGDLTVAGSGYISFKGAGADITSDGAGATTFTNDGTIVLEASLSYSGAFSGQIGDQGVEGFNDLTFVNDGTTGAEGSGYELTINTGGDTVTNGSNGVLEAVSGATLAILSNITNQGVIQAGSSPSSSFGATTGTVDLGKDGGTESMTNTGAVAIYAGSDLAIGGAYTITGSGTLYFKGAGADIISNGPAPTFTNATTIEALASGQIGDSDLTFDNTGTAGPSGSGVTLTINTGSHIVVNSGTLVAANDGTLAIVSNVNNQETISAGTSSSSSQGATTGTVDLGADGGTGSTANSGTIDIWAGSDLAISGNYTVAGSGYIGLKGAGADITSDGKAAATFTNASTIDAFDSGQIGDEGILASNDLTFVNTGTVLADALGSGFTLTLNTGGHTINDGGGTLEAENGATLAIDSNVDTGQPSSGSPPGGSIEAGSGGTVILETIVQDGLSGPSVSGQVVIAGGTFEMLAGSSVNVPIEFTAGGTLEILGTSTTVSVSGSNGAITAASGDTINLKTGTGDTITGTGFTVNASSGTGVTLGGNTATGPLDTVNGSSVTVGVETNSHVQVTGSNDTVTMTAGAASVLVVNGSNDAITAASGDTINLKTGTGDTITGTGFTVNASSGTGVAVGGNTSTGPLDTVNGSSVTIGVETNSHVDVTGSNDTVTMTAGAASVLVVNGSNDAITAASGDTINLKTGTGDTITGTGFTVNASSGTGVTVGGNTESGVLDVVDGSSATVGVETNSHADVTGSNDTVTIASGAASVLVVNGSNDAISAASGDTINLKTGTGDTITGTGFTVNASSGTGVTVGGNTKSGPLDVVDGSSATVGVETNSHVDVTGSNDTVTMTAGAASVLVVNGSNDAISAASGDAINLKTGTGDTITGTGFTVNASSGTGVTVGGNTATGPLDVVDGSSATVGVETNSHADVTGSHDTVTIAAGAASVLVVNGSNDAITAASGDTINLKTGTGDTITGTGFTVNASSGTGVTVGGNTATGPLDVVDGSSVTVGVETNSHADVTGSHDMVTIASGAASVLVVNGSNDAISAASGDTINLKTGTGDTITGNGFTVNAGSGVGLKIIGTADIVYAGLNDSMTDGGSGSLFKIGGSVGSLTVSGFGADTASGVFDLLGGIGGYTTALQADAALTSDGSGGSLLALGTAGSLDIAGVPKSSLSAANFKIG